MTGSQMPAMLAVLQHALGVDQHGCGRQYREHFVTGPRSDDFETCQHAVAAGLMVRGKASPLTGGDDVFFVSRAGRAFVAEHSPPPPKLSRSQARYRTYCEAESSLSFGEWLRGLMPALRQ